MKDLTEMSTKELNKLKIEVEAALELKAVDPQVIRLRHAPDHYRGELCCIEFLDAVTYESHPNCSGHGTPNMSIVKKNGVKVGILRSWYGSNGRGRLAAQKFERFDGVTVEWL